MATTVVVGDTEFVIDKVKAKQIAGILRIVSRVSLDARRELAKIENPGDTDFLWAVLGNLSEEDLVSLAALSIGCDRQFAEENFDLSWVVTALAAIVKQSNIGASIANFTSTLSQEVL